MPEKQDTWKPIGKLAEELARKLAENLAEEYQEYVAAVRRGEK